MNIMNMRPPLPFYKMVRATERFERSLEVQGPPVAKFCLHLVPSAKSTKKINLGKLN